MEDIPTPVIDVTSPSFARDKLTAQNTVANAGAITHKLLLTLYFKDGYI